MISWQFRVPGQPGYRSQRAADGLRRGPVVQTNPISAGRENSQSLAGDGVAPAASPRTPIVRNEPNFSIADWGRTCGAQNAQNEPNSGRRPAGRGHRDMGRGAIVQNEPNLPPAGREDHRQEPALSEANGPTALTMPPPGPRGSESCETKPKGSRR